MASINSNRPNQHTNQAPLILTYIKGIKPSVCPVEGVCHHRFASRNRSKSDLEGVSHRTVLNIRTNRVTTTSSLWLFRRCNHHRICAHNWHNVWLGRLCLPRLPHTRNMLLHVLHTCYDMVHMFVIWHLRHSWAAHLMQIEESSDVPCR
jgi:hypothetical protein